MMQQRKTQYRVYWELQWEWESSPGCQCQRFGHQHWEMLRCVESGCKNIHKI